MNTFQVALLGRFTVRSDEQVLASFASQKAQELFCYLLVNRCCPQHREFLASLLWENVTAVQSRGYFRKVLWQLQSALERYGSSGKCLVVEDDWIQVNSGPHFWLDLTIFEEVFHSVKAIPVPDLENLHIDRMEQAVALYQGDLLQGWYQDWCLWERERFQHMRLVMLDMLVSHCIISGAYEKGIAYGIQILQADQVRECTHRQLMQLYSLRGDRARAIRQYQLCVQLLDKELGVGPAAATFELYHQISSDTASSHKTPDPSTHNSLQTQVQQLSSFLSYVQGKLAELETEIAQQIRSAST